MKGGRQPEPDRRATRTRNPDLLRISMRDRAMCGEADDRQDSCGQGQRRRRGNLEQRGAPRPTRDPPAPRRSPFSDAHRPRPGRSARSGGLQSGVVDNRQRQDSEQGDPKLPWPPTPAASSTGWLSSTTASTRSITTASTGTTTSSSTRVSRSRRRLAVARERPVHQLDYRSRPTRLPACSMRSRRGAFDKRPSRELDEFAQD